MSSYGLHCRWRYGIVLGMRTVLVGLLCGAAAVAVAGLVACPDCGREVSARAVWCPGCGCPGEAIAEAARAKAEAEAPKPPAAVLEGVSDRGCFALWPVSVAGKAYLLADLAEVEGVRTLLVSNAVHQVAVDYRAPKVAGEAPWVLFETPPATNILFRAEVPRVVGRWGGEARALEALPPPERWQAISPRLLREEGAKWRAGERDPAAFKHPFYQAKARIYQEAKHD